MTGQSLQCERARVWASLAADDEISELELASLHAHLAVCPSCAASAAQVDGLVRELRSAPHVEPERVLFRPMPSRWTRVRGLQLAAAAAAVVLSLGLGRLAGSLTSPAGPKGPARSAVAATQEPYVEQTMLALLGRKADRTPRGRIVPV
jgi:anti-sigma factor RsiW